MKNFSLLIIVLSITVSCTYLRKVESGQIAATGTPQCYDGTYVNRIDNHHALWPMLTNGKSKDSTGTITIRTLDKNTLLISHSRISSHYHSYLIKGSLKKDGFHFRRKKKFLGIFPLIWGYQCLKFTLRKTGNGKIILSEDDYRIGFMIILPAAGNDFIHQHVLTKSP